MLTLPTKLEDARVDGVPFYCFKIIIVLLIFGVRVFLNNSWAEFGFLERGNLVEWVGNFILRN